MAEARLRWENDVAGGPMGCRYVLHSEHIRREGRHWWVVLKRADGSTVELEQAHYPQSKRAAMAGAQRHARSWEK